ncbi:MAG: NADH-quinone oxidoreductase subunit L [Oligoflexales bacterium]|nr:NADH-quinone oxidoreductase subunit L [Oligoflexales bacterium]
MFWIAIIAPLIGAILNGFVLRQASKPVSHIVGVGAMAISFACSLVVVLNYFTGDGNQTEALRYAFSWIEVGSFSVPFEFILDRLSLLMLLVVTGIGLLIHIYAGGYMAEEEGTYRHTARFFAYLNLFVFMMLMLVLGNNLLLMFVGWEGVGLCSYLLIGYWYEQDENAAAGMKAFLVNRIGDIGFLLGIFLTFKHFGTLAFTGEGSLKSLILADTLSAQQLDAIFWITLCLFIGACGKSAQLPLYVWLPDAMAGPTPVSALIHAATMVTAGIYMMTRLNFMFYLSPTTMAIVACVGALTAFFAATIAIVQNDIKKVLAYSTVSQLGYMVMATGVGAFGASVFHLFTHACFKALLFLGAGSVIVAMHHKQDMREMGGLRKYMPVTHAVFLVGVLAIIGFPGLAGFFSKDEILWKVYIGGEALGLGKFLWIIGTVTAALTAFYMVRLYLLTFHGENRSDHHTQEHLHETSPVMWAPLIVLALMSALVGYLGVPPIIGELFGAHDSNLFEHYLTPVLSIPGSASVHWEFLQASYSHALEWTLMAISVLLMFLSAGLALVFYGKGPKPYLETMQQKFSGIHNLLSNKYFVDEFYHNKIVQPLSDMAFFLWRAVDVVLIDGLVNGVSRGCAVVGSFFSLKMSGNIHRNSMLLIVGFVVLLLYYLV